MLLRAIAYSVERLFGLRGVWTMGFSWEGRLFGGVSILCRDPAEPLRRPAIEAVVTLGAIALQRELSEERLRRSEGQHRILFETSPDGIALVDADGHIIRANRRLAELLLSDAGKLTEGRTRITDLVDPTESRRLALHLEALTASHRPGPSEYHCRRSDGSSLPVEVSGAAITEQDGSVGSCMLVFRDVTERRLAEEERGRLQAQLLQAQKMEAVGRLAGGIAHDFNNLLTVISGHADLMVNDAPEGDSLRENAQEIRTAARRAAELTSQLLSFGRKQIIQPTVLDLNGVLREGAQMMQRMVGDDVLARIELCLEPTWIRIDRGQLSQVILNLTANARDAMPRGGEMLITTSIVPLDGGTTQPPGGLPAGEYVLLGVRDNGGGMDAATLAHLFEPFFTTKEQGRDTGLGLSTAS